MNAHRTCDFLRQSHVRLEFLSCAFHIQFDILRWCYSFRLHKEEIVLLEIFACALTYGALVRFGALSRRRIIFAGTLLMVAEIAYFNYSYNPNSYIRSDNFVISRSIMAFVLNLMSGFVAYRLRENSVSVVLDEMQSRCIALLSEAYKQYKKEFPISNMREEVSEAHYIAGFYIVALEVAKRQFPLLAANNKLMVFIVIAAVYASGDKRVSESELIEAISQSFDINMASA